MTTKELRKIVKDTFGEDDFDDFLYGNYDNKKVIQKFNEATGLNYEFISYKELDNQNGDAWLTFSINGEPFQQQRDSWGGSNDIYSVRPINRIEYVPMNYKLKNGETEVWQ